MRTWNRIGLKRRKPSGQPGAERRGLPAHYLLIQRTPLAPGVLPTVAEYHFTEAFGHLRGLLNDINPQTVLPTITRDRKLFTIVFSSRRRVELSGALIQRNLRLPNRSSSTFLGIRFNVMGLIERSLSNEGRVWDRAFSSGGCLQQNTKLF